ncbi:MAG: TraX family protein [Candidatus Electrothrix scaldis]|nr:MAG: TraX family protein [Candidatus Electrothrix sp. GW3-3]
MIKILACIFMFIDHTALVFFPDMHFLRFVGRLAFPIFAYQVATGLLHTSDMKQYAYRLFFFAFLSQLPFSLLMQVLDYNILTLNILFPFAFSVLIVHFIENKSYFHFFVFYAFVSTIYLLFNFDFGFYGIMSVIGFYVIRDTFTEFTGAVVSAVFFVLMTFISYQFGTMQIFALCAVPLFFFRDRFGFPGMKYFYYAFYPAHLLLLWVVFILSSNVSMNRLF